MEQVNMKPYRKITIFFNTLQIIREPKKDTRGIGVKEIEFKFKVERIFKGTTTIKECSSLEEGINVYNHTLETIYYEHYNISI